MYTRLARGYIHIASGKFVPVRARLDFPEQGREQEGSVTISGINLGERESRERASVKIENGLGKFFGGPIIDLLSEFRGIMEFK